MPQPGSTEAALELGTKWATLWDEPSPEKWVAQYAPRATYLDHAMMINRQGLKNLRDHYEIWKRSNPDLVTTCRGAWPGEKLNGGRWRYIVKMRYRGTFLVDLPVMKATGKPFDFPARVEFVVREDGLIEETAEWYSTEYSAVVPVEQYARRGNYPIDDE